MTRGSLWFAYRSVGFLATHLNWCDEMTIFQNDGLLFLNHRPMNVPSHFPCLVPAYKFKGILLSSHSKLLSFHNLPPLRLLINLVLFIWPATTRRIAMSMRPWPLEATIAPTRQVLNLPSFPFRLRHWGKFQRGLMHYNWFWLHIPANLGIWEPITTEPSLKWLMLTERLPSCGISWACSVNSMRPRRRV